MRAGAGRRRLDEVLIEQGAVSEVQVAEALMRQRAHGGKFASHLLYFRYLDETVLAKALATQFGCEAVVLSGLDIPQPVIDCIPHKVAVARRVVPFDLDAAGRTLKVACEDPSDPKLQNELSFLAQGRRISLFVTPEISITAAIERYYHGRSTVLEDHLQLTLPDVTGDLAPETESQQDVPGTVTAPNKAVLMITDEAFAAPILQSLLERDDHDVELVSSLEEAADLIRQRDFAFVFWHRGIEGDHPSFMDTIRRASTRTIVHRYGTPAELILREPAGDETAELLLGSLSLFTSLLATQSKQHGNHSGRVGRYAGLLCQSLALPADLRLRITSAAYLHDLARVYYDAEPTRDKPTVVGLSRRLLGSVNYPEPTLRLLDAMYADAKRAPEFSFEESLGGQVLTLVDMFCESVPDDDRLALDRFEAIKKKLRDLSGKVIESSIVEAFIALMQAEILTSQVTRRHGQVMLYARNARQLQTIELRLRNEGFRLMQAEDQTRLLELCARSAPDSLLLLAPGDAQVVSDLVSTLVGDGLDLDRIPTLLLVDGAAVAGLTPLLERGIEDILAIEGSLDFLVGKLARLHARIERAEAVDPDRPGARGRLADMSLIDLLQALGPGRRTVRITARASAPEPAALAIYLEQGEIRYAECDGLTGAEAVYRAITWSDGTWAVDPVTPSEIPPANNEHSNESILMEGCRLLDERLRSGQLL